MIKNLGGVFGNNPTFNNVTVEDTLTLNGQLIINGEVVTGLNYKGAWNASTNTPTLTSSVGINGDFYIVSVAGTTNLNGITSWSVGDWAVFAGSTWQKVEGGTVDLTTGVSGILPIANGGTNQSAFTSPSGSTKGLAFFDGTSLANDTTVTDAGYDTTNHNLVSRGYTLSAAGVLTESTTSRTLSANDNGKVIYCTNGSTTTITTASGLGAGFNVTIIQGGAGKVTIAQGSSTTLVSYSSLFSTMGQYAVISVFAPVADTFLAAGNLGV